MFNHQLWFWFIYSKILKNIIIKIYVLITGYESWDYFSENIKRKNIGKYKSIVYEEKLALLIEYSRNYLIGPLNLN